MLLKEIWSGSQHILTVSNQHIRRCLQERSMVAFLREWLAAPKTIGAICPSSRFLARTLARQVTVPCTGHVVELGPGTGVVTQALLDRGVPREKLILIEFSASFVQRLRRRFPGVLVINGNAIQLAELLPPGLSIDAIVSSLPLCSLPESLTRAILDQWHLVLGGRGGVAVQFTYNVARPGWLRFMKSKPDYTGIVWANLPPARVTRFHFPARPSLSTQHHDSLFPDTPDSRA